MLYSINKMSYHQYTKTLYSYLLFIKLKVIIIQKYVCMSYYIILIKFRLYQRLGAYLYFYDFQNV